MGVIVPEAGERVGSWDTGAVSTQPQPAPRPQKARLLQDGRDMFWSLAPLVAGLHCPGRTGGHVFISSRRAEGRQGADVRRGRRPEIRRRDAGFPDPDAEAARRVAAQLRVAATESTPGAPTRRRASRCAPGVDRRLPRTPTGMYLSLTQSNADEDKLVRSIHTEMYPTGAQDVAGTKWIVYEGGPVRRRRHEPVWTTRPGRSGRSHPDRDNRCRISRRVPYAGHGDPDRAATARPMSGRHGDEG